MRGDGGNVKITRVIPSLSIQNYCGDDVLDCYGQRVRMALVGRHTRDRRDLANQGIHPAEEGRHCGTGGLPAHI